MDSAIAWMTGALRQTVQYTVVHVIDAAGHLASGLVILIETYVESMLIVIILQELVYAMHIG